MAVLLVWFSRYILYPDKNLASYIYGAGIRGRYSELAFCDQVYTKFIKFTYELSPRDSTPRKKEIFELCFLRGLYSQILGLYVVELRGFTMYLCSRYL